LRYNEKSLIIGSFSSPNSVFQAPFKNNGHSIFVFVSYIHTKSISAIVNSAATLQFLSQISVIITHRYVVKSSMAIIASLFHINVVVSGFVGSYAIMFGKMLLIVVAFVFIHERFSFTNDCISGFVTCIQIIWYEFILN
jgi:hypothetical protein